VLLQDVCIDKDVLNVIYYIFLLHRAKNTHCRPISMFTGHYWWFRGRTTVQIDLCFLACC